ncbi:MAG: hypothetical protein A2Z16_11620 [Chloroflexi bacterium RBG_16_54_18]|nr:MAG: hypothetical protein A2Z16_11620 [Chloroflexi bacterium RBG_16_54_18]
MRTFQYIEMGLFNRLVIYSTERETIDLIINHLSSLLIPVKYKRGTEIEGHSWLWIEHQKQRDMDVMRGIIKFLVNNGWEPFAINTSKIHSNSETLHYHFKKELIHNEV